MIIAARRSLRSAPGDSDSLTLDGVAPHRHRDFDDAVFVRVLDITFGRALRQWKRPGVRPVAELRSHPSFALFLRFAPTLGGNMQHAVAHTDLDVLIGVDAREFGPNHHCVVLDLLLDTDPAFGTLCPIEDSKQI